MVPVMSLWMPILVSAVIVFVASSVIHMALPFHKNDFRAAPREDDVMAALRPFNLAPGDYAVPRPKSMADMKSPAFVEKMKKGPVVWMTVIPPGPPNMGPALAMWFCYSILVSFFSAYITGRALGQTANYLAVFRFAGATAFMGYSFALLQNSIWYKRAWRVTILTMFDGLIYGLLTAGTFGWLWPR